MWCPRVRSTGRHYRGEAEDGNDCVCLFDGNGLHPEHGFREESAEQYEQRKQRKQRKQREQRSIMSRQAPRRAAPRRRPTYVPSVFCTQEPSISGRAATRLFHERNTCIYVG